MLAAPIYSKAFDCLYQDIIKSKQQFRVLSSLCLTRLKSYLPGQLQRVQCNNVLYEVLHVKTTLPEGGEFELYLYSIYVNNLLKSQSAESSMA